jgi:hypothetical protein
VPEAVALARSRSGFATGVRLGRTASTERLIARSLPLPQREAPPFGRLLTLRLPGDSSRREHRQVRIARGIRSGSLTAREAARIEAREAALARDVRILRRDGLSPRERVRIERRQDRLSRDIYRQKPNRQARPR